ncbi:MAG: CHAP domain-containing protein [Deltaproteobacteria bacterium]|nr:CHAP domain-containing protein [Deltaproteobacteria bacterium]
MLRSLIPAASSCLLAVLAACSGFQARGIAASPFQHVALRSIAFGQAPVFDMPDIEPRSASVACRCVRDFRHPVLNRCESWKRSLPGPVSAPHAPACPVGAIEGQLAVARHARSLLARPRFDYQDRHYSHDCAGFVLSVLDHSGLRPRDFLLPGRQGESGVALIYRSAEALGAIHRNKVPAIGDLVFFDNTHDRNRDGRANDPLTHVGIVEKVDADGTVSVIHHVRRGVLRYKMNLFQPSLRRDPGSRKVLNHHLRLGANGHEPRLTGELFHAYATLLR